MGGIPTIFNMDILMIRYVGYLSQSLAVISTYPLSYLPSLAPNGNCTIYDKKREQWILILCLNNILSLVAAVTITS